MAYSTIKDSSEYFQNISWTGNGGTQTVATTGNSDLDPDIVWTFSRSDASNNKCWFDTSRGNQKILVLQGDDIEATSTGFAFDFPAGGDGIDLDGSWGHINYNSEKKSYKYLQPIIGYVPFILKNQLRYGYAVFYVEENTNGFLEFVLSQKSNIFKIESKQNLIKLLIKKFLNMLLFSVKVNDLTTLISIKKSKVKFFQYT